MSDFHNTLLKGNIFKEVVKVMLEKAGYLVVPYGYETSLTSVRKSLAEKNSENSPTARRIRSSPDLLVYDEETKDVRLVEVKMSSYPNPRFRRGSIEIYQEFWHDAILVEVVPFENVFYSQEVSKLGIKDQYDPASDFRKIQDMFSRISPEILQRYGDIACDLIQSMKTHVQDVRE